MKRSDKNNRDADKLKGCKNGHNRWKTLIKGKRFQCRSCGEIREII